jgi:hypothetical protein
MIHDSITATTQQRNRQRIGHSNSMGKKNEDRKREKRLKNQQKAYSVTHGVIGLSAPKTDELKKCQSETSIR